MVLRRKAAATMLGLLPLFPCLFLLSLPGPCSSSDEEGTVVLTTSGPIRGKRLPVGSSSVTAFLGVPYAQPPLGPLRFQKPLPHQPWTDVLEATGFGHACPQPPLTDYPDGKLLTPKMPQSEDCLFLNVWVPHPRPPVPAPILVWIHPGVFYLGAASLKIHDGRFLAAYGKMIVVSMNYRLGALGFLALPPAAPGNAGLWDQRLALRWLQDNAAAFGGDPAHLMLSGQGSGGASVGFHLLSPGSQFLFTRAVLQSGSPISPGTWTSLQEAQERGRRLGQLMGCANSDDTALVGCLQEKEAGEFIKQQRAIFSLKGLAGLSFVPTPDGDFLPDTPPRLLQAKQSQRMPIATGFTPNEGSYILLFDFPGLDLDNTSNVGPEQLLHVVRLVAPRAPEEAVQAMAQRYSQEGASQGEARYLWAMEQILGDYFIVCPVAEVAKWAAEAGSPVYVYYFDQRLSFLSTPEWTGVPHGAELPYQFGTLGFLEGANRTHTDAEELLVRKVIEYNAEFARSGAFPEEESRGEKWPRYDPIKQNVFHIRLLSSQIEEMPLTQRCSALASLLARNRASQE